jgi:hypothetical protein
MSVPEEAEIREIVDELQEMLANVYSVRQDEASIGLPEDVLETSDLLRTFNDLLQALRDRDQISLAATPDDLDELADALADMIEAIRDAGKVSGGHGIEVYSGPGGTTIGLAQETNMGELLNIKYVGDGKWTGDEPGGTKQEAFEQGSDGSYIVEHLTRPTDEADLTDMADWYAVEPGDVVASEPDSGTPYITVHQFKSDRDDKHHAKVWQEPYTDSYIEVDMNGYSGGGGTDEHIDHVEADSGATNPVSPVDHLVLSGTSGEIETSISDNGGGKATVTFSLADAAYQTIGDVEADNATVSPVDHLVLSGTSDQIETEISDDGGGKATVTFSLSDTGRVRYGQPTAAYTSGATITLDPCDPSGTDNGEANVTVQAGWSLPANTEIPTTAIIPFQKAADGNYYAIGEGREVVTDIQYDTSTHKLQKKVRMDFGAFSTTESSSWVDITTAVDCTGV